MTYFLDELGNLSIKFFYTFDFYTFESVSVDAHCLKDLTPEMTEHESFEVIQQKFTICRTKICCQKLAMASLRHD